MSATRLKLTARKYPYMCSFHETSLYDLESSIEYNTCQLQLLHTADPSRLKWYILSIYIKVKTYCK